MQLGRYEILEPIGLGASSTVFKARDTLIGRIVAIKTLQSGLNDPAWRDRFMAEARIVGQLSHPRIVKLHDVGIDETSGSPYLVMEYVVGQTLEKHIAAKKMDPLQAYTWGAALARALAYAHEQGIVHGDVKPANIIINQDGRVMLTDFGIARFTAHISHAGTLRGTPAYLAPEQIEGKPTSGKADLFSLGIVLYLLATGRRPFEGDSMEAVCAQILKAKIIPPSKVNPLLPRAFDGIIARCLAREPEDRYANGEILSTELESLAQQPSAAERRTHRNGAPNIVLRYAGVMALLTCLVSAPVSIRFYRHNLRLPLAPVTMYPAPKPPADVSLGMPWTGAAETAPSMEAAAPAKPGHPRPARRQQPQSARIVPGTPDAAGAVAKTKAESESIVTAPVKLPEPSHPNVSTASVPMTIEISAQSTDGTLAVFADHEMVFSTPLAAVAAPAGEPFRTVCTLMSGRHHLSVALYKANNSLRAEKQGLAELHNGDNLLGIRVVKHSKIFVLRGTGLEISWPSGSTNLRSEHAAKDFSATAVPGDP